MINITELIKFDKLQEENETLKKELAELKQQQLYKEHFAKKTICWDCGMDLAESGTARQPDLCLNCGADENEPFYELKHNSKYDKLPSKDVK